MSNKISTQAIWLESVDSTNEEAKRLIDGGKIQDTVFIVANEQTNGKGTHGRKWLSPKEAGIYLSVIHIPKENSYLERTDIYTKSAGIACVESIKKVCGIDTKLKSINDIYVDGKKLGGILVETRLQKDGITSLITGIGINTHRVDRKVEDSQIAPISLEEIMPKDKFESFSKKELIGELVMGIYIWHEFVFKGKNATVEEAWSEYKLA